MNADVLAKQCVENINFYTLNKMPTDEAGILLTTPKGWKAPPRFPRGRLNIVKEDGTRVWHFNAMRLLAYLVGNKLTTLKIEMKAPPKMIGKN
jgi:hypothetical protein